MVTLIVSTIITSYFVLILIFWLGWEKIVPGNKIDLVTEPVSIIIAVRDEAENIENLLGDINAQDYPTNLIEIIIVDDHSTDSTLDLLKRFVEECQVKIRVLELIDQTGKKAALNLAINSASYEIILTTDGDCRLPKKWLKSMVAHFASDKIKLVSGPVYMNSNNSFFGRIQSIEFSSLISSGAATMSFGWPTMANAANLAFKRSVFFNVGGHSGQEVNSGDDIFLLHKLAHQYSKAVVFCGDSQAIVETSASKNLKSFFHQRKRWAGKWQFYKDLPTVFLATFIFLVNLTVLSLPILITLKLISWVIGANLFLLKVASEFLFLKEVQKFFNSKILLHEFLILAIIYPVYVTLTAVSGLVSKNTWKGRVSQ